ncbi:hypothetical protein ACQZV8_17990 [Magnetococcales bacterium HHB-1]
MKGRLSGGVKAVGTKIKKILPILNAGQDRGGGWGFRYSLIGFLINFIEFCQ